MLLLLLPPFQDRLLGHLWVGAAQVELPVAISMNSTVTVASGQWQNPAYLWQMVCIENDISLLPCEYTAETANAHHVHAQHWGHVGDTAPGQCQTMLTGFEHIQDSSSQPVKMPQQPAATTIIVHTLAL